MCECKDVAMGSYDNQTSLPIPKDGHPMSQYMKVGLNLKGNITVDTCLMNEILDLWSKDIYTTGCCCGHNLEVGGYIGVGDNDIPKMKSMGYEVRPNECRPGDEDSFYPKSTAGGEIGNAGNSAE
jgi:hypothetical protein